LLQIRSFNFFQASINFGIDLFLPISILASIFPKQASVAYLQAFIMAVISSCVVSKHAIIHAVLVLYDAVFSPIVQSIQSNF
jgi:hypothetical protein